MKDKPILAKPKWIDEFKAFALKGNVIDLAVAVVIGGAFGKIVASLVNDIIMPCVGYLTGGINLTHEKLDLGGTGVSLSYGNFLQSIIDFLIIALSIFFAIKALSRFRAQEQEKPADAPPPTTPEETLLLREIRDLLKKD